MTDPGQSMDCSDADLWAQACAGDADAFAAVFDRHVDRVHRQARRFAHSREDAEDVTAMVFLEAWRLRSRVRVVNGSVIGWLLVTAANIARNSARTRMRHERLLRRLRPDVVPDHAEEVLDAETRSHRRGEVETAFARLSASDQEILALCVIEEVAPADAARLLRVPAGTVRTRLSRAKQRLRVAMTELTPDARVGGKGTT
ncbi:sigma-70 family RNA polymerase sigma factor [Microbacterium sp. TPD7012]|uniref:RNA polymerase sigma factor n=1 Tax=Microbacterium sp. TPD7012 TaxID=2171975 RepID=UPI001FAE9B32|nr:sigma-70 family RNA polymerase sigma factor [Microbacterium sp. TPD7012]